MRTTAIDFLTCSWVNGKHTLTHTRRHTQLGVYIQTIRTGTTLCIHISNGSVFYKHCCFFCQFQWAWNTFWQNAFWVWRYGLILSTFIYKYIYLCLGLFVQTDPRHLSGWRGWLCLARERERERVREGKRDAQSPTERYDSPRLPCCLLFCVGGAVNYDRRFDWLTYTHTHICINQLLCFQTGVTLIAT